MSNLEYEYKFLINEFQKKEIIEFLNKNGQYIGSSYQKDVYYIPKFRDFETNGETTECLRVRTTEKGSVLCYKKIHREANPIYCDEYETKIESAEEFEKILLAIDFEIQMTIEKTRESFRFGDCQFDLDEVKDFGDLIEVEFKGDEIAEFDKIFEILNKFNIFKENANYEGIQMLIKKKRNKGE